jgi:hypothetical protein
MHALSFTLFKEFFSQKHIKYPLTSSYLRDNRTLYLLSSDSCLAPMNGDNANNFNGLNTQRLNSIFSSIQKQPEMAKVAF